MYRWLAESLGHVSVKRKLGLGFGLFIAVVMAFPNGLAGLYEKYVRPRLGRVKTPAAAPVAATASVATPAPSHAAPHPKAHLPGAHPTEAA